MNTIPDNLEGLRNEIAAIARDAGRKPDEVKLLAVSKTKPAKLILEAYHSGQRMFGENRVQELECKVGQLPGDIEWHLIGHLQGNKAVKAVNLAACIHSVDSVKLLKRLDRLATENSRKPRILLEINVSGEESKFGLEDEEEIMRLAEEAGKAQSLNFQGLMTMAPFTANEHDLHRVFSNLRDLRDKLQQQFDVSLPELSMGMSSDYRIAIEEGSTIVRIGTAIFGHRG